MFDPESDKLVPLSHLARGIPNRDGGTGINVSTTFRWAQRGIKGRRLQTQLVGGIRMSCGRWLAEFFAATTAAADGTAAPAPRRADRDRRIAAAERELAAS